jgi:predicted enzyme related to lactoylglutathione lyase
VINGVHAIIFSEDAEGVRMFFRDVIGLRSVDAGGGWPIFALPPAELAAHPGDGGARHELYLMCDDIEATVKELTAKGVEFTSGVSDAGFGLITSLRLPDGGELALYEPRHPSPLSPAPPRPPRSRWTSFVADEERPRVLHEQGNRNHRLRVEHSRDTLLVHLSDEDGQGWIVLAVDRATRRWTVGQAVRQVDAAQLAYAELYPDEGAANKADPGAEH